MAEAREAMAQRATAAQTRLAEQRDMARQTLERLRTTDG
jgi:hypothetical protein